MAILREQGRDRRKSCPRLWCKNALHGPRELAALDRCDIDGKLDGVSGKIDGLRTELLQIVASAVGAVMRDHGQD